VRPPRLLPDERGAFRRGDRVQYVGVSGTANGSVGIVRGVAPSGVLVRWTDSRHVERVHPDVRPLAVEVGIFGGEQ
jgi:hypothetical protein